MEDHAGFLDALIQKKRQELEEVEHAAKWPEAIKQFDELQKSIRAKDPAGLKKSLDALGRILENGRGKEAAEKEIRSLIAEHAKLKPAKAGASPDAVISEILPVLTAAVEAEVKDASTRRRIAQRISEAISPAISG